MGVSTAGDVTAVMSGCARRCSKADAAVNSYCVSIVAWRASSARPARRSRRTASCPPAWRPPAFGSTGFGCTFCPAARPSSTNFMSVPTCPAGTWRRVQSHRPSGAVLHAPLVGFRLRRFHLTHGPRRGPDAAQHLRLFRHQEDIGDPPAPGRCSCASPTSRTAAWTATSRETRGRRRRRAQKDTPTFATPMTTRLGAHRASVHRPGAAEQIQRRPAGAHPR